MNTNTLQKNNYFIKRLSGKYILPSILSMIFLYAGFLVDTLIVGYYLGEKGLSAMSLVGPVYLIYYTFGSIIGIGGSIHASRILGGEDYTEYKKVFTCSTIIMLITGSVMTVLAYALLPYIIIFLCRDAIGEQYGMVKDYLVYFFPGGMMTMLAYIPLYFAKTDGKPRLSSRLFFMSAIANIVLSWLFISPVCGMGIGGTALATSISSTMMALLGLLFLLRGKTELKFVSGSLQRERIKSMVVTGLPNGLNNLLKSAGIYLINFLIIGIGAAYLLPCHTVIQNVMDFMNAVSVGLIYAFVPLFGVFLGERDFSSLRGTMKLALRAGALIIIPLTIIICLSGATLFRFFGITDLEMIREGQVAVPLACTGVIAAYINLLNANYLTAIKHEKLAMLLISLRLFVVLAACAIPLSTIAGTLGIWVSFSLSEIFTLLIYYVIRLVLQHKNSNLDRFLIDISKEPAGDITFSVKNQVNDIVNGSRLIIDFCRNHEISLKQATNVSLAIEEILTYLTEHRINADGENFIDVRVLKQDENVCVRFRYVDKIFDLKEFYEKNKENEVLRNELLGLKIVSESCKHFEFNETLGCNNIIVTF